MLGGGRTVTMSADEAIERWRKGRWKKRVSHRLRHDVGATRPGGALIRLAERGELWLAARRKPSEEPLGERIHLPDPVYVALEAQHATASTEKARERLGWKPRFDFETGAHLTEQWARWANLVPYSAGA
jgi:hypothetical protein